MAFNNEIEEVKAQIKVLEKKLSLLEEIEKQPRMNLQQEGEYAVVSYHDKVYYRLMNETTFSWYKRIVVIPSFPTPTLVMVEDAETERLLEGLYYNHIQVKKEKEQRTKTPVEECYKDWWGQYPELETDSQYDDTRWQGFQAGYEFAWAIAHAKKVVEKVQEEQEENEWKSVALRFGEKLSGYLSDGYYELSPAAWFRWAVFTYGKGQQIKETVRESKKWCEENPDKDPLDWLKPQTPEQTSQSLKEAFIKAQQTENWKETQKLIDEEDNDKNFKNSLDLIKEWGEKNKPQNLTDLIFDWWDDVFTTHSNWDMETSIEDLVDRIDKKFIPPSSDKNGYEWEKCLKMMREKLR
jgi:hypothetical protein